ncbi:hypothetical protein [Adhaeretor mobilis]|uniref:Uncharacterized protein n=1 Tax=Adhaeretor mobilis TaxID=1930276 RepID=A0A517MRN0_9BACT|nr:hypothetical protein [Adhaeretor mobilis]QDS97542.1 hypothetical protein HG15A2_08050 [Adhaeretor mobilis]
MARTATKKAAKKTTAKKKVNKSAAIREFAKANPKVGPTDISRALAKKGIKVAPAQVSTVISKMKGGNKKPAKVTRATKAKAASAATNDRVSFSGLLHAQKFVQQVGSIEEAKSLVDSLQKLQA